MSEMKAHQPAARTNIPRCTNCHNYMPTLITMEAVRFCNPDCCHEWSAKQIGATDAHEAFNILNYLRVYLRARLAQEGEEAALVRLCMASMQMFRELPLENLCPQPTVIQVMAEDAEKPLDPDLNFP